MIAFYKYYVLDRQAKDVGLTIAGVDRYKPVYVVNRWRLHILLEGSAEECCLFANEDIENRVVARKDGVIVWGWLYSGIWVPGF